MRRSASFWGLLLLILGLLFLLSNLNLISVNLWGLIWPIFLILLGVWFLWGVTTRRKGLETETVSIPLEGARQAQIQIQHGAGSLTLHAQAQPDELLAGTFTGGVERELRREGDQVRLRLNAPVDRFLDFPWLGPTGGYTWSLGLNDGIRLDLILKTGASESTLDLSHLLVDSLRLETGASATLITLPEAAGKTRVDVQSGAAEVKIRIPAGVAARIKSQSGLSSIQVDPSRFPRTGEVYESPDYATAANTVDITLQSGVGAVDVR